MPSKHTPEKVRQRMSALRDSLDFDVERVATSFRTKTSWKHYVENYPWLTIAAAAAVGYLVVPRRVEKVEKVISDPEALAKLAKQQKLVVSQKSQAKVANGGLTNKLIAFALAAASKVAMGYVSEIVGSAMSRQRTDEQKNKVRQTSAQPTEI